MLTTTSPQNTDQDLNRHPDMHETEDENLTDLKLKIERDGYSVDSKLVAGAIIHKLRVLGWARRELATESGRTPKPKLRGH